MSVNHDNVLRGPLFRPRNIAASMAGSIHEERTATALGMRGALVTGRTLLVAFAPLLLRAFGQRWFEHGSIGLEFRSGVLDQEELRAVLQAPATVGGDAQLATQLERPSGEVVARGTAAAGPTDEPSSIGAINPLSHDTGDYQLVAGLQAGDHFPDAVATATRTQAAHWDAALPSLDWFTGPSPWGGPIASPAVQSTVLTTGCTLYRREHPIAGVAVDGAIELRNIDGPLLLDRPYQISSSVIGRGSSPRTEYIWYESVAADASGRSVCAMRMQLRFMTGSSSLVTPA